MSRHAFADCADKHAATDWAEGRRWTCTCPGCSIARRDGYDPRSTRDAMVRPAQSVFVKRIPNATGFQPTCIYGKTAATRGCGRPTAVGSIYCRDCGKKADLES